MTRDIVLSLNGLSVCYYSSDAGVVDISFDIRRGEVLGLLGESGSGKSTICKAILGLLDNNAAGISGSIALLERDITTLFWDERENINGRDIGVILQNPMSSFNPCMKIKAHITETICAHLLCKKRDGYLYGLELLERVGLEDRERIMESYPSRLSGGMLQRIMIAIAIALNPVLLIADEPTTALDTVNQKLILDLLAFVVKEYRPAMLLVSHDLKVMSALADHIAVMQNGIIVETGSKEEIIQWPRHPFTKELIAASRFMEVG